MDYDAWLGLRYAAKYRTHQTPGTKSRTYSRRREAGWISRLLSGLGLR